LRRALLRASRNITRILAALGGDASAGAREERSAEATPLRRMAAAAADGATAGRAWTDRAADARFRRSS
jgi:hypothetical protein